MANPIISGANWFSRKNPGEYTVGGMDSGDGSSSIFANTLQGMGPGLSDYATKNLGYTGASTHLFYNDSGEWNPNAAGQQQFDDWMQKTGYSPAVTGSANNEGNQQGGWIDADNNVIPGSMWTNGMADKQFWTAAQLAAATISGGTAAGAGMGSVGSGAVAGGASGFVKDGTARSALTGAALGGAVGYAKDYVGSMYPSNGSPIDPASTAGDYRNQMDMSSDAYTPSNSAFPPSSLEPMQYDPNQFSGVTNATGAGQDLGNTNWWDGPTSAAVKAGPELYGGLTAGNWASLGQGALALYGQHRAIGAAQDATNQANQTAQGIYNQQRSDNAPLLAARDSALGKINALLADPSSVSKEPGYQFGLDQGQKQLDNSAAAAGNYYSGGHQKATARYNQDYASTKFDQSLNRLTNLAGLGQVGANNTGNALNNYGNQTSQNTLNMGGARGSGYTQMGRSIGNALGQLGTSWNQQDAYNQVGQRINPATGGPW